MGQSDLVTSVTEVLLPCNLEQTLQPKQDLWCAATVQCPALSRTISRTLNHPGCWDGHCPILSCGAMQTAHTVSRNCVQILVWNALVGPFAQSTSSREFRVPVGVFDTTEVENTRTGTQNSDCGVLSTSLPRVMFLSGPVSIAPNRKS